MSFDENTQIFITESKELLDDMEEALLELERSPNDADLINRVFRAAHTIKGSSGLFGFDHIIEFTHVVENLLDDVRNCIVPVTDDLINLFMRVKDHIASMIDLLPDESKVDMDEQNDLLELLKAFSVGGAAEQEISTEGSGETAPGEEGEQVQSDNWHISIHLGLDTFRQGFKPAVMFEQLKELGEIVSIRLNTETMPDLEDYNP